MYTFRKLKNKYQIKTITVKPDGTESSYACEIAIEADYNIIREDFTFELMGKKSIRLNDRKPSQAIDLLMICLSGSLYPIKLRVARNSYVEEVINFKEIRERWERKCREIQTDSYSILVDNYISLSMANMRNEESFLNALKRDSFIQFYFPGNIHDSFEAVCYNFPILNETTWFCLKQNNKDESFGNVCVYSEENELSRGKATYECSDLEDLLSAQLEFSIYNGDGEYMKKVHIHSKSENREIKKANKGINFFVN